MTRHVPNTNEPMRLCAKAADSVCPSFSMRAQFAQDFRIQATCRTPDAGTKLVIFTLTILPRQGETGSSAEVSAS